MEEQERDLWKSLLDTGGSGRLRHVLCVSIHRVDVDEIAPSAEQLLSFGATPIKISRFDEPGVATFLSRIFHWTGDDLQANYLVAFLFDQTLGTPFFLQTLTSSLVQNRVVYFNFDTLKWSFKVLDLQDYASPGVDHFLARSLEAASPDVKLALGLLSCLPARGVPISLLAGLLQKSISSTESLLLSPQSSSAIIVDGDLVRFAHDRIQQAASNLVEKDNAAQTHFAIAVYLRTAGSEYAFDAVDNFLRSRSLGRIVEDPDELALLSCQAAQRSSRAASYNSALDYLVAASELVDFDTDETWRSKRHLATLFARTLSEASAIAGQGDDAIPRIRRFVSFCQTKLETVDMRTLLVRLLVSTGKLFEAIDEATEAIKTAGYDANNLPQDLIDTLPSSLSDFRRLEEKASGPPLENPTEEDELAAAVTVLVGLIGTQIYVFLPDHGTHLTRMCLSLAARHTTAAQSPSLPYLVALNCVTLSRRTDLQFVKDALGVSKRLLVKARGTMFYCLGLLTVDVQAHATRSLKDITFRESWEHSMRGGDLDTASYVLGLECLTSLIAGRLFREDLSPAKESWFDSIDSFSPAGRILVNIARQTVEHLQATEPDLSQKHRFDGSFINRERDWPMLEHHTLHRSLWILCEMWCGLVFPSSDSREYLFNLVHEGTKIEHAIHGFAFFPEWNFIKCLFFLTHGTEQEQSLVADCLEEVEAFSSPDWVARAAVVRTLVLIRTISTSEGRIHWSQALPLIEATLETCVAADLPGLVGLISFSAAIFLQAQTKNPRLVSGYAHSAHAGYIAARVPIIEGLVLQTFPSLIRPPPPILSPTLDLNLRSPRASSKDLESVSQGSSYGAIKVEEPSTGGDQLEKKLDLESFLKTTLLIAGERDSSVLIVKLMKVLLQFTRSDFGALAIVDPTSGNLHLRSAGSFTGLSAFDLPLTDCSHLAPVSFLQHVGTTKKPITSSTKLQDLHRDSFFSSSLPRSAMVLPLSNQGRFSGVVFLSSKHIDTTGKLSSHAVEVVTSLAILACISVESSLSTKKLERLVTERTASLQSALNAKQTFLSHMSHELRTPLFAVLGLAAVLEDSPGLNSVQREHLSTIRTSGEDLQTIISNLLDWSRLESGSLQAESIPFSLRDVIETTLESVATMCQTKGIEVLLANSVATDPTHLLLGDPFRIKQVLLNLLSNSSKFTTASGSIIVRWKITKNGSERSSKVVLSVADTGVGIPPQKMDRLFKSFSQVDSSITRSHGGSGLGLAISQSLAKLMGGSCSAKSELGKGSTFDFSFVVQEASDSPSPSLSFPPHQTPRNAFLLCPLSPCRQILEENLVAFRVFPIRGASTVQDAISPINPEGLKNSSYDFVFVNPQLVSLEMLRQMHELQPNAKFLYLPRVIELASVVDKLRVPHSSMVTRPVKASLLHAAIQPPSDDPPPSSSTPIAGPSSGLDRTLAKACPMKILLVDDSKINIMVGRKILERFGYGTESVSFAYDGQQAITASEKTRYDLIFMDLSMPVVDGYTANDRIRASPLTGTPVIIALTANADRDTRDLCEEKGFFAHLVKPLNIPSLHAALRRAFDASQRVKDLIAQGPTPSPEKTANGSPVYLEVFLMGC
ncbi:hypothetical protein BDY24DRAFT_381403 [Mrakia frigida]|uniref:uncharacterized protein n=1 Tax=Mrakia frigida TaxID=29902 RepID=UPI003FCC21DA